jgi:hypothetical protein
VKNAILEAAANLALLDAIEADPQRRAAAIAALPPESSRNGDRRRKSAQAPLTLHATVITLTSFDLWELTA